MRPSVDTARAFFRSDAAKLVWCTTGVVGTLLIYGIMQERIIKIPYGEEGETFKHSLSIVLCNRILTCCVVMGVSLVQGKSLAAIAPWYSYAGVSLSNVVATTCQYEALKYVSYAIQTLAKSGKMIPVLVWGTVIMQKKYGVKDYLIAVTVTLGCAIFFMAGPHKAKEGDGTFWGILLMAGYLGFDGFTSTFQDKLFKGYNMDTSNQIFHVTLYSSFMSFGGLVTQGNILPAIQFVLRHPQCLFDITLLSLAATTSQFFISYTIKTFGALVFATIMTTRQLLSIVLSTIVFGHLINMPQVFGALLVFSALYYKAFAGGKSKKVESKGKAEGDLSKEAEPLLESKEAILISEDKTVQEEKSAVAAAFLGFAQPPVQVVK